MVESYDYDAYGDVTVTNERLEAVGCRYLEISPPPACAQPYALKVTSPDYPEWGGLYIDGNGDLTAAPVVQDAAAWGAGPLHVTGIDIIPATVYRVVAEDAAAEMIADLGMART